MTNEATKKYDPGLAHLRKALRLGISNTGADRIIADDGEGLETFGTDEAEIERASEYAADVDGTVDYRIGIWTIRVIYDGPYSEANAAEIINDCNQVADLYLSELSL